MIASPNIHVAIENETSNRGIHLRGRGPERVGPCPICGGRDRFSINVRKQIFNCRHCNVAGDVIALVMHLDGVGFKEAVRTLGGEDRPRHPAAAYPASTATRRRRRGQ